METKFLCNEWAHWAASHRDYISATLEAQRENGSGGEYEVACGDTFSLAAVHAGSLERTAR